MAEDEATRDEAEEEALDAAAPPRNRVAHLVDRDHAVVIRIDIVELAEAPPKRVAVP